jgi:hypothetical protein
VHDVALASPEPPSSDALDLVPHLLYPPPPQNSPGAVHDPQSMTPPHPSPFLPQV